MSDGSSPQIHIYLPNSDITIEPGETEVLQLYLFNGKGEDDELRIIVEGIPTNWISNDSPIVSLPAGNRIRVDLNIHPPESTSQAGQHRFTVRVISQDDPNQIAESSGVITIAALDTPEESDVRLFLSTTQFSVQPGGSTQIAVTVLNQGSSHDRFRIALEGIPSSWVIISDPDMRLDPGGQADLTITVQPPRTPRARAGLYPVVIRASSHRRPDQSTTVNASISVAGFSRTGRGSIALFVWDTEISVAPGANTSLPMLLINEGELPDNLQIFVEGAPSGWITTPPPIQQLAPGDQVEFSLYVQLPQSPAGRAGRYPLTVRVASQRQPDQTVEFEVGLNVAAFQPETKGPIRAFIWTTQFSVVPGGQVEVPMSILNSGRNNDLYRLSIEGLPSSWLSLPDALPLAPGDQSQVTLGIRPPRSSKSRAGRYPFTIQIDSQQAPGQHVDLDCTLTVGAFSQFSVEVQPQQFYADQLSRVVIKNQGNIQLALTVWWQSEKDNLMFEPSEPQSVRVPAGESSATEFSARPALRPIFGGEKLYPFSAFVQSSDRETRTLTGDVISSGRIPFWSIPIVLILCCTLVFAFGVFLQVASQQQIANETATVVAAETGIAASLTAAAIGSQTATPTETPEPTVTLTLTTEPSATEAPPTNTPTITHTAEPATITPTLTETPVPPTATDTPTNTQQPPSPTPTHTPTATPPLGGTGILAFSSDRDGDSEIYILNLITNTLTKLTNNGDPDLEPSWNPNGNQIAFASQRDGNSEIYAMNADGSLQTNLTTNANDDDSPDWEPNGARIAFASNRSGNWEIYRMNPDGSDVVLLSNHPSEDRNPVWSPDSSRIAFASNRDGDWELFSMSSLDGTGLIKLTNNGADDRYATWSPGGGRIAFASNRNGNWDIFIMNADGSDQTAINSGLSGSQLFGLKWSPDGKVIAFTTNDDGNQEVYAINTDGSGLRNLTNHGDQDAYPAWKPE